MTEITFDLFTNTGKFRRDITEDEINVLDDKQRAALKAVEAAADELESVSTQLKTAEDERKALALAFDKAKMHLNNVQPRATALSEQRRAALPAKERERLARIPIAPEIKEAIFAAAAAEDVFEGSKVLCRNLQNQLLHARGVVAAKIVSYQGCFIPQSPSELIRDHINREHQRRIANGGVDTRPDEAPAPSPLDAYMKSSRSPLGIRNARQANRGAFPASMRGMKIAVPAVKPWQTKPMGTK
jgi:hypothetical protein